MNAMENTNAENLVEEVVVATSKSCWKKLGIAGGVIALVGAVGYIAYKKINSNKEVVEDTDFDAEDLGMLDEDIAAEEE